MTATPSQLSDVQRQILDLLGQGHTAKTIAAHTGLSVAAVNERLRDARRKTGVGSSRELARMMRVQDPHGFQENRDELIGMAAFGGMQGAAGPAPESATVPLLKGASIMVVIIPTAAAAFVAGEHRSSPSSAPRVIATSPQADARIAPGAFDLSVTFDRPMRPGSYSFVATGMGAYPDCEQMPRQSADGRTFTLRCTAGAGQHYVVGFNHGRFHNFVSRDGGVPARPAVLAFSAR